MASLREDSFTENTFGDLSYSFLEPVPNYLTCIMCYGLLKEPVATDCCEKMFCSEHTYSAGKVCPACRHTPLSVTRNKGIDSIVKDLKVFCQHHDKGCQWKGHLCFEPNHRGETCGFEVVSCAKGCEATLQRQLLETHILEECPRREVKCEFCNTSVTAAELESHQESCPDHPVLCPHGCGMTLPRKEVEEHSPTCSEVTVPCPLASNGCNLLLKSKDLADHLQTSVVEHLSLISKKNTALQKEITAMKDAQDSSQELQRKMQSELQRVSAENATLRVQLKKFTKDHATANLEKLKIRDELRLVKERCGELSRDLHTIGAFWRRSLDKASATQSGTTLPLIYKYSSCEDDADEGTGIYTYSFYTSDKGYHLCLTVYPDGLSVYDWMSITVLVLPGTYDDNLPWPMEGSLTVEVLNQQGDYGHFSKEIYLESFPRKWKERAMHDRRDNNADGWGILRFMRQDTLFDDDDDVYRYVFDGTIYLRITRSAY